MVRRRASRAPGPAALGVALVAQHDRRVAHNRTAWAATAACRESGRGIAASSKANKPASSTRVHAGRGQRSPARSLPAHGDSRGIPPGRCRNRTANRRRPAAELVRNRARELDGQIADAPPRVEDVGVNKGVGRAGIEARPAGAAMIGGVRHVVNQLQIGHQGREKEPASPSKRLSNSVFLPIQPKPASWANSRSKSGAVSTTPRTRACGAAARGDFRPARPGGDAADRDSPAPSIAKCAPGPPRRLPARPCDNSPPVGPGYGHDRESNRDVRTPHGRSAR